MARKQRQKSATGIYHVMLRGINKQNIFFSEEDMVKMMFILKDAQYEKNYQGKVIADDLCTIYAYCILDNHIHVLIRENRDTISKIMKRIEDRYAAYYNLKYERIGHLFQGRFPSEPVNDGEYFHRLLRYIHRNSVKAMEARTPEEYPYSSWNEYVNHKSNIVKVLKTSAIATVTSRYPLKDLIEWVDMDVDDHCMDMDKFRDIISDKDAFDILADISGISNPEDFRLLDHETQIHYLLEVIDSDSGISQRQASRLGTITYNQINYAYSIKHDVSSRYKSTLNTPEEIHEKVRNINGVGKINRHRLYLIVEYLFEHNESTCAEISQHISINPENTRRLLVRLLNANIISQDKTRTNGIYSLNR